MSTQAYLDQATSNADGVTCGTLEAANYGRWFRAKAQAALDGLKDGTDRVLSDEEVQVRRTALRAKIHAMHGEIANQGKWVLD